MSLDTLGSFVTTPEFYSGLVTGALVSRAVQKTVAKKLEEKADE